MLTGALTTASSFDQLVEIAKYHVGTVGGESLASPAAIDADDETEPAGLACLHTGDGVLEHDRLGGRDTQQLGRLQEGVGRRLPSEVPLRRLPAGDAGVEPVDEAHSAQDGIAVLAGRYHRDAFASTAHRVEQRDGVVKDGNALFLERGEEVAVLSVAEAAHRRRVGDVGRLAAGQRNTAGLQEAGDAVVAPLAVDVPDIVRPDVEGLEGLPMLRRPVEEELVEERLPRLRVHRRSLRDDPVEIEEERVVPREHPVGGRSERGHRPSEATAAPGGLASVRCLMLNREIVLPPEHLFPPDEWRVIEARWTPQFSDRAETVFALANGYVGVRGTLDEGRPSLAPGTFISGFHETWPIVHAEEAYGLARVGQSMINAPDATVLELFVDDEPLFLPTARMREYSRVLDMRTGILQRHLVWSTAAGKHITVRSSRLVSLEHRHLVVITYEVAADCPAPIAIVSRVINRADARLGVEAGATDVLGDPRLGRQLAHRILQPRLADDDEGRVMLGYEVTNSLMTHAVGVHHVVDTATPHRLTTSVTGDLAETVLSAGAQPGVPIRIVKYITYQTSRSVPPRDLAARCHRTLDRALEDPDSSLVEHQREHLDRFWDRADVVVADRREPVRVQQAVRWNVFQLCQASWRVEGASIPSKGLTGGAYDGHYFWDTEAYVLPFLAYTEPRIARNLLRFRHSMLAKARERAALLDLRGALFPWRTINGDEASALYQAGTAQYHINADIAYAIRRYVDVRGDTGFLADVGAEILVETARMWEDLGFYGDDEHFHLHGVTGPDEYTTVVNDNAFTNLMARLNLHYAATAVRLLEAESPDLFAALCFELSLDPTEIEAWDRAADAMFIPYDPEKGITPQDDSFLDRERWDLENTPPEKFPLLLHYHPLAIYRKQVLKQADVVMAMFLLGNEFTPDQKARNFSYYDPLTTGDSSLSASIQSIVASEIGDYRAASRYFDFALLMDLANVAGNVSDGVHIASAAGAWMALVFGFGGVRDFDGCLTIDPRLPRRFERLSFSLRFRGRQIRVTLAHDEESYAIGMGEPIDVQIRGEIHRLAAGAPLRLPVPTEA